MSWLFKDFKGAFRVLLKSPGFTLASILSLAIGIGANGAVFSVTYAVLLRALPYEKPEQLMVLKNALLSFNGTPTYTNIFDWKDSAQSFSHLAAYSSNSDGANLTDGIEPERIEGAEVSSGFFPTFGINAVLGRVFQEENDQPGKNAVMVISYGFWQRRFASERSIVGRNLILNGNTITIIGVAPPDFEFPGKSEFWIPISFGKERLLSGQPNYQIIGRLKADVTKAQAQAEINVLIQRLKGELPNSWVVKKGIQVVSLLEQIVSGTQTSLLILSGIVALVLIVACSNVANLLLARATNRQKEIAIRLALGAGRIAIIRQLLVESLLLSLIGGTLGLLTGSYLLKILIAFMPDTIPRIQEARLNTEVILLTLGISLVSACFVGIVPALQALKVDINTSLKGDASGSNKGLGNNRIRGALVISEIVLTMIILVGTGLLVKSLSQIHKVEPGYTPEGVITLNISLPETKYATKEQRTAFFQELLSRIRNIPGTLSCGAINYLPLGKAPTMLALYTAEGQIMTGSFEDRLAANLVVTPDYLKTMAIPLIEGRYFTEQDMNDSQPRVIIDQSIAQSHWQNESSIGKRLILAGESTRYEIVGVVATVRHLGQDTNPPKEIYIPCNQSPLKLITVVIKNNSDQGSVLGAVRREIQSLDNNLPIHDVKTMQQRLDEATVQRRFIIILFSVFAGVALLIASLGVYSVMAYTVAQRTREIGIRISLGAQQSDVLKLILASGFKLALIGVGIGIGGALAFTQFMSSMLFEVTSFDPATLVMVSVVILALALLASYLPALKATKVNPVIALRSEEL
jgi:putative ABC transport system permease protein